MGADLEGQPTKGREASALEATQGCISLSVSHVDSFILTISVLEYRQFCYFQPALCSRHHAPVVYILSFACILRARHFRAVSNRVRFQPEASESIHSDTSTLITKEVLMPTARPQSVSVMLTTLRDLDYGISRYVDRACDMEYSERQLSHTVSQILLEINSLQSQFEILARTDRIDITQELCEQLRICLLAFHNNVCIGRRQLWLRRQCHPPVTL
jgi:hypothetical protein